MASTAVQSFARPQPRPQPRPQAVARERSILQPQEGWLSVLLLVAMVGSTVWSIDQARWVEGTGILFPLALAGLLAGLAIARSKMAGPVGILLGLVLGTVVVFVAVGQLVPPPHEI